MNTDNLIRLLKLTADNKSPVVQDLRREIAKYVNDTETLLSEYETSIFGAAIEIGRLRKLKKMYESATEHIEILREIFIFEYVMVWSPPA